jgi:hypothetical protein
MPTPVRIWLEVAHHTAFRIGGWAFVRQLAGALGGTAGGERQTSPERSALQAISAALSGVPPGAVVELHTASPQVLAIPGRIAGAGSGEDPPTDNLELWARAATALRPVDIVFHKAQQTPGGPSAFAAAWAEFAQGRARQRGAFSAPIPKVNLAKAEVRLGL